MSEWKCLTAEEERIARGRGEDPDDLIVNRAGDGLLVFLNMKTRKEIIVRRYLEKGKQHDG